ncbi:hypothetical protein C8R44DRAFT_865837 [Mycena epipterygia]|nr:hypothetical protein C8R44DRAFT_865837 [Mycena epipterygia]
MVVASCTGGGLEIFDGQDTTHNQIEDATYQSMFKVRSADVKFVIFGDQNTPFASAYSAEYTQHSDISHPQPLPPPIFTPEQRQYREKRAEHYRSTLDIMGEDPGPCADEPTATKFRTLCSFLLHKLVTYTKEPMLEEILLQDKSRQERLDKLVRRHWRFEGYKVQAAFKTSHNKGSRGVVKAECNDQKRDARVASLALRNRRPDLNDVKGILCHVQWDASNKTEDIPIENLVHQLLNQAQFLPAAILNGTEPWKPLPCPRLVTPLPDTPLPGEKLWAATPPLPEPTLAGEDTGEWLCNEALLNKHLDVVFEGITTFGNRILRNSPKWLDLDGKTAVLVLATSAPNRRVYKDSLMTKKVKVFCPGSDMANPLEVPPPTVKPHRTVADGTSTPRVLPTPPPRLVQAVLSQYFYNLSMYAGDIGFTHHLNARQLKANLLPGPHLSRDLPTFKINDALPFPSPETEVHYKANLQAVYYQAAIAFRPMAEYWGEIHLERVFMEACQEDASFLARHFEHVKVVFRAGLGPRANRYFDVEAVKGSSLWLEVKPTGTVIHTSTVYCALFTADSLIARGPGICGLRDTVVRDCVHDYRAGLGPRANSYLDTHAIASGSMWLRVTADLHVAPAGADLMGFEAAIAADEAAALDSSVLATSVDSDAPDDAPDYSTHATSVASSNDSMPTLMSAITTVAATPDVPAAAASMVQMLNFAIDIDFQRRNIRANVLEWALNVSGTGEADQESTHNTV